MSTGSWNNHQTVSKIPKQHRDRTWTAPEKKIIDKGENQIVYIKYKIRIYLFI